MYKCGLNDLAEYIIIQLSSLLQHASYTHINTIIVV